MPYTLSHAVIALPIAAATGNRIPVAALAVGSMSPDFPYLVALTPIHAPGHSFTGVLTYCLAPSLLVLGIWFRWIERPLLDLARLPRKSDGFGIRSSLLMLLGILLGAYSHILWDASSHATGMFVVGSEVWHKTVLGVPIFKWNQYASGVLGIVVLAAWYLRTATRNHEGPFKGRVALGLWTHSVSIVAFAIVANLIHSSDTLYDYVVRSAIGVISGGFIGMCLYALIVNLRQGIKEA